MRLRILIPTQVLVDEEVSQVTMESEDGSFSLLPGHIDYVATLVPGLLMYRMSNTGDEVAVATDEGVVVKQGQRTFVSCRHAVKGRGLEELARTVEEEFESQNDQEKKAQTALAKIEADFVRTLLQHERV